MLLQQMLDLAARTHPKFYEGRDEAIRQCHVHCCQQMTVAFLHPVQLIASRGAEHPQINIQQGKGILLFPKGDGRLAGAQQLAVALLALQVFQAQIHAHGPRLRQQPGKIALLHPQRHLIHISHAERGACHCHLGHVGDVQVAAAPLLPKIMGHPAVQLRIIQMDGGQQRQHAGAEAGGGVRQRFAEAAGGQLVIAPHIGQLYFVFPPESRFLQHGRHSVRVASGHGNNDRQKPVGRPVGPDGRGGRFLSGLRHGLRLRFQRFFAFPARIVRLGRVCGDHPAAAVFVSAVNAVFLQKPLYVAHGYAPAFRRGPDGKKLHRCFSSPAVFPSIICGRGPGRKPEHLPDCEILPRGLNFSARCCIIKPWRGKLQKSMPQLGAKRL